MTDDNIPEYLKAGARNNLGTFHFEQEDIIRFAKKFDPQFFHTDPVAAKDSLFGSLCASGWHTISVWMKLQRKFAANELLKLQEAGMPVPEFGPSPGMKDIKWPRPVYAGDSVTYFTKIDETRKSNSKPGWFLMQQNCEAFNQKNEPVLSFLSTVFIRIP